MGVDGASQFSGTDAAGQAPAGNIEIAVFGEPGGEDHRVKTLAEHVEPVKAKKPKPAKGKGSAATPKKAGAKSSKESS